MKIISFPTCSITPKIITNNNVFAASYVFKSSNLGNRYLALFLTHCSAKRTTHTENTKETIENNPQKDQPNPISEQTSSAPAPSSRGLVFDLGQNGSWDSIEIGSPVVKRFLSDDQERWYMWYHGSSEKNPDNIGLAISSNGVHWQRGEETTNSSSGTGIAMTCGADWWAFDTKGIRPSEVMIMSSNKVRVSSAVYWMYYTGFSSDEVKLPQHFDLENVFMSLPGLAISQDGRNWARIEGDHHSGALFDVGSNGEWDSLFVASPHVVFHSNGDLRMYYHSFDPKDGKFAIGLARSRDGIKWLKLGKVVGGGLTQGSFDEMGVTNACVVREKKDGKYLMAFEGIDKEGKRSIGLAISEDGLKDWRRMRDEPGFEACSDNGWDCKGVGSPCLVPMEGDDQWRLYYTGVGFDGRKGIGLAVSKGNDLANFTRWPGFHL